MKTEMLIKGGTVFDGTGAPPVIADILVKDGRIASVSPSGNPPKAEMVIDASGLAVSPGFIDAHAHSEFTLLADPSAESKIFQGVTTEVIGNCGLSGGPLIGEALSQREADLEEYSIKERWNTLGEFLQILESRHPSINIATLAGHGNIRASVMGYSDRMPDEKDTAEMKALLSDAVSEGAIGLSTGLIYPPGIYSRAEEIQALAIHGLKLKGEGFLYASHMRSEGNSLLESIRETLGAFGGEAKGRIHISHIKTAGKKNWHKIDGAIGLIGDARKRGVNLTADRYPYTAASTDLDSILPPWALEGGNKKVLKRLADVDSRNRILNELRAEHPDAEYWRNVFISSVESEGNRWMEGRSMADISKRLKLPEPEAALKILESESLRVQAIFHSMSEDNLRRFLGLPFLMLGSDSSARSFDGPTRKGKPHPRGFGSFPRFLKKYCLQEGLMELSEGIRKITSLPARTFGLRQRGEIREGFLADIIVFDPERIGDEADFTDPYRMPVGIIHVLVNGVPAILDGRPTGRRAGRVLRGGG